MLVGAASAAIFWTTEEKIAAEAAPTKPRCGASTNKNLTQLNCGVLKLYCLGHNISVNHEPVSRQHVLLHAARRHASDPKALRSARHAARAHARPMARAQGDGPTRRLEPERARRTPRHGGDSGRSRDRPA